MTWPGRAVVAGGRRISADRAYEQARLHAVGLHTAQPASWWGLCALLSSHQFRRGTIRPMPVLWAELLPFLLIDNERLAERALERYLAYLDDASAVDLQWLGLRVNEAMDRVEHLDEAVGAVLEDPTAAFDAPWMALLSYPSLLRLRRAVALYGSESGLELRPSFWHGMAVFEDEPSAPSRPRAALPISMAGGALLRMRFRPDGRALQEFRRFRPLHDVPVS
jgi:hypothetical protein